ncbi:copper homeostasis protein CutC [Mucilaginibacter sp.]|jgi:copper homeostasis protein|uniref:copper homeostasis protein CutC n=1 Tax=Mucilaginibacter sp. TaxID=1882438 RepID=UPI002B9CB21F|nr:copper homeostasis protein CutC [Mucilaginibacter sp.]HTI57820.1 copper homeostasis protein CutC [Mucilaginibacter sp.]
MNKQTKPVITLEVCANSVASAIAAQEGGAVRVELCENLSEGGTTPSYGQITLARKLLSIKLYVLIRPRGGDFLYSNVEFDIMKADVQHCIETGCDGIVIGILNADGSIDKKRCSELVSMAKSQGLGVTFHRAIDMCADMNQALEDIIELGCERILTSGGKSTAVEGVGVIAHLVEKAVGRISIMPGAGVSENTVADIIHFTGAMEIHSSARKTIKSQMGYKNDHILMGYGETDEYSYSMTDVERVRSILREANG